MPQFTLPEGYSFEPPPGVEAQTTVPGFGLYGGADVSQQWDATGIHYVACCASGPGNPPFRFRAFKETARGSGQYVEVPLPFLSEGRGEQDVQWYDGKDWGIAWQGNAFNFDVIPGFVPFPSIPSLEARIRSLETTLAGLPPGEPLPQPASGTYVPVAATDKYIRLWFGQPIANGATQILVPGQGPAVAYAMRVTVEGPVGAQARLGPNAKTETALTARVDSLNPGSTVGRGFDKGTVNAADDGTVVLYAEGGATKIWVDMDASFKK